MEYLKAAISTTTPQGTETKIIDCYNHSIEDATKYYTEVNPDAVVMIIEDDFINRDRQQHEDLQGERNKVQGSAKEFVFSILQEGKWQVLDINQRKAKREQGIFLYCYRASFCKEGKYRNMVFLAPSEQDAYLLVRVQQKTEALQIVELNLQEELQKRKESTMRIWGDLQNGLGKMLSLQCVKLNCEHTWHMGVLEAGEEGDRYNAIKGLYAI